MFVKHFENCFLLFDLKKFLMRQKVEKSFWWGPHLKSDVGKLFEKCFVFLKKQTVNMQTLIYFSGVGLTFF